MSVRRRRRRRQYHFSVKNYRFEFRCFPKSRKIIIVIIISAVRKAHIDFCNFWIFLGEIAVVLETLTIIKTIKFFFYMS